MDFSSFYQANDFVSVLWPYQNEIHHVSEAEKLDISVQAIPIPLAVSKETQASLEGSLSDLFQTPISGRDELLSGDGISLH